MGEKEGLVNDYLVISSTNLYIISGPGTSTIKKFYHLARDFNSLYL